MHQQETGGSICTHCGKDASLYESEPYALKPGSILKDRYLIGVVLGAGGFGITYIGNDQLLDITVAIKEFYPTGMVTRNNEVTNNVSSVKNQDSESLFAKSKEIFWREAKTLAAFNKESGIVSVQDFFIENNTAYIVTEYLEGESLKNYISRVGKISYKKTLTLLAPVMDSLIKVHKKHLIHRDISPDNIMLSGDSVKLIDFGSARQYADNASLSIVLKHGYAPLEQYSSRGNQGEWTDVYAICATIYYCITGNVPLAANDRVLLQEDPVRPSQIGIKVPKQFEDALMKGLALRAENRVQSVSKLKRLMTVDFESDQVTVYANDVDLERLMQNDDSVVDANPSSKEATMKKEISLTDKTVAMPIKRCNKKISKESIKQKPVLSTSIIRKRYDDNGEDSKTTSVRINKTGTNSQNLTTKSKKASLHPSVKSLSRVKVIAAACGALIIIGAAVRLAMRENDPKNDSNLVVQENSISDSSRSKHENSSSDSETAVFSVSLDKTSLELKKGETYQVMVTGSSGNVTNKSVSWSSSNISVATVNNGMVTAHKEGEATITAKTYNGVAANLVVKVSNSESGKCGDNVNYTLDENGLLIISGKGSMYNYTSGNSPFYKNDSIKEVDVIGEVTDIGSYTFQSCSNLTNISIPNSVTSIGEGAFWLCSNIRGITIPNSVMSIGERVFYNCEKLNNIIIPDSITNISNSVFAGCKSLTSVIIPESVNSIGEEAFNCCYSLESITIPDNVLKVEKRVFNNCTSLKSIIIPDGITSIGDGAFSGCSSLATIMIPNSVTNIGKEAFYRCGSLKSIIIPDGITSISDGTFAFSSLATITIPNSVTNIGKEAFQWCGSLKSIIIPDGVTSIGERAFYYCECLTNITVPNSVVNIGEKALGYGNGITIECTAGSAAEKYANDNSCSLIIR